MKLIVGLGNPGKKYQTTRHNAGWLALDYFIEHYRLANTDWGKKFDSEILEVHNSPLPPLTLRGEVMVAKPQTFMNESGRAVKQLCDFYKIDYKKDLLVLHDDIDLPFGKIKSTASSSAAGHNGVKDLIEKLGSQNFSRIRIGVESRTEKNIPLTETFVLQNFSLPEIKKLQEQIFPEVMLLVKKFLG